MPLDYVLRASRTALHHPRESLERIRGRIDSRSDRRAREGLDAPAVLNSAVADPALALHTALALPSPCPAAEEFGAIWDMVIAELQAAGARVGLASYRGWNDGDRAMAEAVWCLVAHLRPAAVVETGVAHGLTTRIVLEGMERNETGHLYSIDLPAVDTALHGEIGVAVPDQLHARWTYVAGTSRARLGRVLAGLQELDLFIHDSLHTARNTGFELASAWPVLRAGGVVVVDDIDRNLAFRHFVDKTAPPAWFAAQHELGTGLWGVAVKASAG